MGHATPDGKVGSKFGDELVAPLHGPFPHPKRPQLFILRERQDGAPVIGEGLQARGHCIGIGVPVLLRRVPVLLE